MEWHQWRPPRGRGPLQSRGPLTARRIGVNRARCRLIACVVPEVYVNSEVYPSRQAA